MRIEASQNGWSQLFLILGIAVFFNGYQLSYLSAILAVVAAVFCYYIGSTRSFLLRFIGISVLWFLVGQCAIYYRQHSLETFMLSDKLENVEIEANIDKIEENKVGKRLYLSNLVGDIPEELSKARVLSKQKYAKLKEGMRIRCTVSLMPPQEPSFPGGFDMQRHLYFKGIGAIGYVSSKIEIIHAASSQQSWIDSLRKKIQSRIKAVMDERSAAIASGLLVGDAYDIAAEDMEAMRIAGTAHLIAISGMHIALIAGIVFFTIKWLLVRIEKISRKYNVKKLAAFFSIFASYFYLLLAGSPVSAERAFVMSSIVFAAIILDKEVDPMKSLGVAASVLLVFRPENVVSPSLQMSLAACLGIIAGFNALQYFLPAAGTSVIKRFALYVAGVVLATITAGAATSIFIAFHFKQFSVYSVVANLLAVPVNDFFIMPCGLLALILMPLEMETLPLIFMEYGIKLLLVISHWVSSLTNAAIYVPFFSLTPLILMSIGLFILCVFKTYLKYASLIFITCGVFLLVQETLPVLLVSGSGKMFALYHDKTLVLSSKISERHVQRVWSQNLGAKQVVTLSDTGMCSSTLCRYRYKNLEIALITNSSDAVAACQPHVRLFVNLAGEERCQFASFNITLDDLFKKGTHAVWYSGDLVEIRDVKSNFLRLDGDY